MPLYRIERQSVLFIHIPKTGGSSVEDLLSDALVGLLNRKFDGRFFPCSPQHFHRGILETLFPNNKLQYSFAVVRDPVDRVMSEYRFRKPDAPFDQWWADCIAKYRLNPFLYDNHIRPMSEFVFPDTEIFRFEDGFELILESLRARFPDYMKGAKKFPHSNPSASDRPVLNEETAASIRSFYKADFERWYPERLAANGSAII